MSQITLTPVHGKATSSGLPVLFSMKMPDGVSGAYADRQNGLIYFYGQRTAAKGDMTAAAVNSEAIAAMVAAAVAEAMKAKK